MDLKLALQDLEATGEVNFFLHDRGHGEFDVAWQAVKPADAATRSIQSDVSQNIVLARKKHLDELLIGQSIGAITVEKLEELECFTLSDVVAGVVSEEVNDLVAGDVGGAGTVHPLESGVQGEVGDAAEALPCHFDVPLTLADGDKQVLQSSL